MTDFNNKITDFEKFLIANSETSLNWLINSLENWDKKSLTFQNAVQIVEKMGHLIEDLEKENKNLKAQLKEAKEYLHSNFSF